MRDKAGNAHPLDTQQSESPFGIALGAEMLVGRSRQSEPSGRLTWTLDVSDQLVEACGEDWSAPVECRFIRLLDGRLDLVFRRVDVAEDEHERLRTAAQAVVDAPLVSVRMDKAMKRLRAALNNTEEAGD